MRDYLIAGLDRVFAPMSKAERLSRARPKIEAAKRGIRL